MAKQQTSSRARKFWNTLTAWYGKRLVEQFTADCPPEWARVIDCIDDERVRETLQRIKQEHAVHPPTFPQFERCVPAKRQSSAESISTAKLLSEAAMRIFRPCGHQCLQPWSYFGPVEEHASKNRGNELISHPRIVGVVIPPCIPCGRRSQRLRADEQRYLELAPVIIENERKRDLLTPEQCEAHLKRLRQSLAGRV